MGWLRCEMCHLAELGIVIICEMSASEREVRYSDSYWLTNARPCPPVWTAVIVTHTVSPKKF